ncbi:MAG: O-antigen ligase family protein [Anaerolineae bacterium]
MDIGYWACARRVHPSRAHPTALGLQSFGQAQDRSPISNIQYPISNPHSPISILLILAGIALAVAPLSLAAAGVAGIAFVIALLLRPEIGLWALPFAVPFGLIRGLPLAGFGVGATEYLVGLTLAAWLGHGIAHRRLRIQSPPLLLPLLLLLGAMLLSATGMYAVPPTAKELVKWGEILVVYVLTFNMVQNGRTGVILTAALLLAGSLSALQGVAGSLLHIGPPQFAILGGRLYRASGTFAQPNPFGGYMNHSLPIAVSLLVASVIATGMEARGKWGLDIGYWILDIGYWILERGRGNVSGHGKPSNPPPALRAGLQSPIPNPQSPIPTIALAGVCGVLVAGLALSWSRGAWLGAMAGLIAVGVAWAVAILTDVASGPGARALRRRVFTLLWLVSALAVVFVLLGGFNVLPASIEGRIGSAVATFTTLDARGANITDANFATLERVAHWQAAWDMWRDHFWTGIGIGNYEAAYADYRLPKWPTALGHAHNIYFNMAAEIGFIGLLAYLAFVVSAVGHTWQVARRAPAPAVRGLAIGVLGVLIALVVHNFFDNMYVHGMGVHLALARGLVSALGREGISSPSKKLNR